MCAQVVASVQHSSRLLATLTSGRPSAEVLNESDCLHIASEGSALVVPNPLLSGITDVQLHGLIGG